MLTSAVAEKVVAATGGLRDGLAGCGEIAFVERLHQEFGKDEDISLGSIRTYVGDALFHVVDLWRQREAELEPRLTKAVQQLLERLVRPKTISASFR